MRIKTFKRFTLNESLTEYRNILAEFIDDDLGVGVIFDFIPNWKEEGVDIYIYSEADPDGDKVEEIDTKTHIIKELLTASIVSGIANGEILNTEPSKIICLLYNPENEQVVKKIIRKCGFVATTERNGSWLDLYTKEAIIIL